MAERAVRTVYSDESSLTRFMYTTGMIAARDELMKLPSP